MLASVMLSSSVRKGVSDVLDVALFPERISVHNPVDVPTSKGVKLDDK